MYNLKMHQVFRNVFPRELIQVLAITVFSYFLFFWPVLNPNTLLAGSDAYKYFYPSRYYLYQTLKQGEFPFWTDKVFDGFAIYADSERAYLNPLNIAVTVIAGPFQGYKILHGGFYLTGSLALYYFLKKHGFNNKAYAAANLIYYFSFFHLYHSQHQHFILATFLLPLSLLCAYHINHNQSIPNQNKIWLRYGLVSTVLIYFGAFQSLILYHIPFFVYLGCFLTKTNYKVRVMQTLLYSFFILTLALPLLLPTLELYQQSSRNKQSVDNLHLQGSFNPLMLVNATYPFFFGNKAHYKWGMVNEEYFIHETYIYTGIIGLLTAIYGFLHYQESKTKRFFFILLTLFLLLGFWRNIPVFNNSELPGLSLFRYWGRSVVFLNLVAAFFAGYFFVIPKRKSFKELFSLNKHYLIISAFIGVILFAGVLVDSKSLLILKLLAAKALPLDWVLVTWCALLIATFMLAFKFNKKMILFLIYLDLFVFGSGITRDYMRDVTDIYPQHLVTASQNYPNERVVYVNPAANWNLGLYLDTRGYLGYSQYVPHTQLEKIKDVGFTKSELEEIDPAFFTNPSNWNLTNATALYIDNEFIDLEPTESPDATITFVPVTFYNALMYTGALAPIGLLGWLKLNKYEQE